MSKSKDIMFNWREKSNLGKARTNHLLIIGIDKYEGEIPILYNAVRDAKNFRDLLLKEYNFEQKNTISLFNEKATLKNIIATFSKLLTKLSEDDNLIFYFSGHGSIIESGRRKRGYWIPSNAKLGDISTYLPNSTITGLFSDSFAHHILGIVDSCFSGSLFSTRNLSAVEEKLESVPSRWLLTAGRIEPVSDGALGENSPFATTLLTHLRNNANTALWTSELCNRVLKGVVYNTERQTPRGEPLQNVGHQGGQFVFYKDIAETVVATRTKEKIQIEKEISTDFKREKKYGFAIQKYLNRKFWIISIPLLVIVLVWWKSFYLYPNLSPELDLYLSERNVTKGPLESYGKLDRNDITKLDSFDNNSTQGVIWRYIKEENSTFPNRFRLKKTIFSDNMENPLPGSAKEIKDLAYIMKKFPEINLQFYLSVADDLSKEEQIILSKKRAKELTTILYNEGISVYRFNAHPIPKSNHFGLNPYWPVDIIIDIPRQFLPTKDSLNLIRPIQLD